VTPEKRRLLGAFAAMIFVGMVWGANLPVTKVMLLHFDIIPMATVRMVVATATLALVLVLTEGTRTLRLELGPKRFLLLGFMMSSFFFTYAIGIHFSNPITAATVSVASPLVSAVTVWAVTRRPFDPGFGTGLALTLLGGAILASGGLADHQDLTFGGGEILVLLSSAVWALYTLKTQAWYRHASQLQRAYEASLSSTGWLLLASLVLLSLGLARQPFAVDDGWIWTQLLVVAALAGGLGSYGWNIGAHGLGIAVAALWLNLVPFFAVLWAMVYGFVPNAFQIGGGLVALTGVVYMQVRKLRQPSAA
jgi:drug/metabolite transporter (DMT)-like permease